MKTDKIVFLVKFRDGYYAADQPDFHWSFTDDPNKAQQYTTETKARMRAEWGKDLLNDGYRSTPTHRGIGSKSDVKIEKFAVETHLRKIE